jgi:DNA-binding MarR family transcriptional regulator
LTHAELAARLQVSPVTVTKMIQRLEKAGFVQRGSDPQDQRFSRVYLTKAGRAIHLEANAVLAHIEAETFAGFSNEEIETLSGYFQKIQTNLGKDTSAA